MANDSPPLSARAGRLVPLPGAPHRGDAADYKPEADVLRIATYFSQRYGSLGAALKNFDLEAEFDLADFEAALKKWGVKVENVVELFDHIDVDWSGTVSVQELFRVLESPVEDIQRREKQRQKDEVKRVYEELAGSILHKFGSIEDAFNSDALGVVNSAELSLAQFSKLVKRLDIELDAAQLQRVFNEIDEESNGNVSVQELQKALSNHLVRHILVEVAAVLTERGGNIASVFEDIGVLLGSSQLGGPMSTQAAVTLPLQPRSTSFPNPPPPLPTVGEGAPATSGPEVSLEKFMRILRQLKVLDVITEPTALLLHSSMKPFSVEDLARRLQEEFRQVEEDKKRRYEDEERRELERKRRLQAKSRSLDSRKRAQEDVTTWFDKAKSDEASPSSVVADWSSLARIGASKTQLHDYVAALEGLLKEKTAAVEDIKGLLLEHEGYAVEGLRDFPEVTPMSHGVTASQWPHWSPGDATPVTPGASLLTPGGAASGFIGKSPRTPGKLESTMQQEQKVANSEKLVQAAAVGDASLVQSCLAGRADVNTMVWGGVTALMSASHHGRLPVLELLLKSRADSARTDMRGRTALDHAHRQTAQVRDWLRGRGFVSGKEIAREAQGLAQSLLAAETQKEQMEKLRDLLPSEEVLRRARLRQKMRGGRPSLSQDSTPFAVSHLQVWPPGRSPLPSPTSEAPGASCLSRSPQETRGGPKARDGRHVQLTLPEQAVRGSLERLF